MTRPVVPSFGTSPALADSLQAAPAPTTPVSIEELASLSHEFRTPLNGVLGLARLLESTPLTGEQRSYVDALRESGEHLLGLVNQLLDFARLGASAVEIQTGDVSLENLLRGVCELTAPRATEKGLEIGWWIAPGLGRIRGDEGRLRQILLNYVANAIKFTGEGGVLVSAVAAGPGRIRLSVSDTGPGVAEAERERILNGTFGGDLDYYRAIHPITVAEQQADAVRGKMRVRIVAGARDSTGPLNRAYSDYLKKLNIAHTFTIVPGVGHDTLALLKGLGEANWEFYRSALSPNTTIRTQRNP
jgi:hypothetical protein